MADMIDATAMSEAQREMIASTIELVYQKQPDFVNRLERVASTEPTNFRGRRVPLEVAPNPSLAFGDPDNGILATPNAPRFNHLLIPYIWSNMGLLTSYNAVLNEGRETVGNMLEQSAESTAATLVKWLNIFASNGDGTTRIALVSARTSNTVLTCADSTDSIGATQVLVGQKVTVWDPTGTTQRTGTVGAGAIKVASTTKTTVTADASASSNWPSDVIAGDIIVPEGTTPSVGMKGIPYLINNTGTYFGLSRTSVPAIQSTIVAAATAALSASLLQATWERTKQRTGQYGLRGEGALELACGITQHEAYSTLFTITPFHSGGVRPNVDIGGDSQEFTWFGLPINEYLDWRGDRMDFINFKYLKCANLKDPGSMKGMPINDELQTFDGTTSNYRAGKVKFLDVARDYYTASPHRFGALTGLGMSGRSMQRS